jgi:hypothetical protein
MARVFSCGENNMERNDWITLLETTARLGYAVAKISETETKAEEQAAIEAAWMLSSMLELRLHLLNKRGGK